MNGAGASVESYVPGRLRVRLPEEMRRDELMDQMVHLLRDLSGVRNVATNPRTGSILVEFDRDSVGLEQLLSLGRAANILPENPSAPSQAPEAPCWPGISRFGDQILVAMRGIDTSLSQLTGGALDAKSAVPLALLLAALVRMLQERPAAPWYTLLWYAYATFMHWHSPNRTGVG